MLLRAIRKYKIDIEGSILVGDKRSDMEAAANAGIEKCFLVKSGHEIDRSDYKRYSVFQNLYEVSIELERRTLAF